MSLLDASLARRARLYRFNPIRNLTPATLSSALDGFDAGYLRQFALLAEVIENRDDVLQIAGPKRRKRVASRPWEVLMIEDTPAAETQKQAVVDFLNALTVTDATDENVRGGFRLLLRQMMNAPFVKYAAHEIVWTMAGGQPRAELRFVPLYFFSNTAGRLGYIGPEGASVDGEPLKEGEWMITVGDSPLMHAAAICYLFKRLSLQDWLAFSERFGIPGIHGETTAAKGSAEYNDFVDALDAFANEWVIATNVGAKINLIEARQNGDGPFAPMVERMDRRLAALILGGDLSTMSRENGVGSNPQEADSDQMLEDDCEMCSETVQTQLVRPLLRYLFGDAPALAYVKILPPVREDTKENIEVDKFLLEAGGTLDMAETYERYSRTLPEDTEEGAVLKQAAPAAPTMPNTPPPGTSPVAATAENDATLGTDGALLQNAMARALGVVPQWLAPIRRELDTLQARAADGLTDAEFLDFTEKAALSLPELFAGLDRAALADELEAAMGTAVIQGVTTALRSPALKAA